MSESNLGRNSINMQYESNNQRALMYDLRSQLSNLKTEFSKLISKPPQTTSKLKAQSRPVFKSRYSYNNHQQEVNCNSNSLSQFQFATRRLDSSKLQKQKSFPERNQPSISQIQPNTKKSPISQQYYSSYTPNQSSFYQFKTRITENRQKDSRNQVTPSKIKQYEAHNYKKYENIIKKEIGANQTTNKNIKTNQNNSIYSSPQYNKTQQNQKIIQSVGTNNNIIINNQMVQLNKKINKLQKQFVDSSSLIVEKDQRIHKLQQTIKQQTQKIIKANEQTMEIARDKNRQIQILKQNQINELKNQQKFYENKIKADKNNIQLKFEGEIKSIKQMYELRLKDDMKQKQQLKQKIQIQHNKLQSLNRENAELQRQRQVLQYSTLNMKTELSKQNEIIKSLTEKQKQMKIQSQLNQKKEIKHYTNQRQTKQVGVNCQTKQEQSKNQYSSSFEQQNKQLQEKLTIYLNNIDKQSKKIKEQKVDLDKAQKSLEDSNRIIQQKQGMQRSVMRDLKTIEKDLFQTKKARRDLQILLYCSNQQINKLNFKKLNLKYASLP